MWARVGYSVFLIALQCQAATFFISASLGADTNTSTQAQNQATPWQHAPGMNGCASNCSAYTPVAGDRFILRGGDTWHSFTGVLGTPWTWTVAGTSGSRIYLGVDQTFFAGGSWTRPIFDGDNPLNTTLVSSCSHLRTTPFIDLEVSFVDIDNFEFKGLCLAGSDGSGHVGVPGTGGCGGQCSIPYIFVTGTATDFKLQHHYFHGWTGVNGLVNGCTGANAVCDTQTAMESAVGGSDTNAVYEFNVIDGIDSYQYMFGCLTFGGWTYRFNVCRYTSQAMVTNSPQSDVHDNLFEHINESADGVSHSNGFEMNGAIQTSWVYNNVSRHMGTDASPQGALGVNFWLCGHAPQSPTIYFYNNVFEDIKAPGNYLNLIGNVSNPCSTTIFIYNNTFQGDDGQPSASNSGTTAATITADNNHIIGQTIATNFWATTTGLTEGSHDLYQSNATANGQGYVAATHYTPSAGGSTIGAGANLSANCGTNYVALCADTTYGVTYNTTNHTAVSPGRTTNSRPGAGPPWDIGAYQFNTTITGKGKQRKLEIIIPIE